MNRNPEKARELNYYALALRSKLSGLEECVKALRTYADSVVEKTSQGIVPMSLPPSSDLVGLSGSVAHSASKLSMGIELAYFDKHPNERPY